MKARKVTVACEEMLLLPLICDIINLKVCMDV